MSVSVVVVIGCINVAGVSQFGTLIGIVPFLVRDKLLTLIDPMKTLSDAIKISIPCHLLQVMWLKVFPSRPGVA